MNEDMKQSPFHPARWKLGKGPESLSAAEQEWLDWLCAAVWRGGFTSLGQARLEVTDAEREVAKPGGTEGGVAKPTLYVSQTALSRWLRGINLPSDTRFHEAMECLNDRVAARRRKSPDAPGPVTATEAAEGKRLLHAARKTKDGRLQPAQRRADELASDVAETHAEVGKVQALMAHVSAQLHEARTGAALVQRVQTFAQPGTELREELDRALGRVQQLEQQLQELEVVLENWQNRYDRLYAQYETALEAAQAERLAMQDELSELRATIWLSQRNQQGDPVSVPYDDATDAEPVAERHPSHDSLDEEDRVQWVEELAQQILDLRDKRRERIQLLRSVCADASRKDIYLLALRLGESTDGGPLARELMQQAGVRYYDPWQGEPSALRQWWADRTRVRLEARPRVPNTAMPSVSAADFEHDHTYLGYGTQI
ncbi:MULTISPECIES: hypothetical protein [unclassified Streptomyces]|uniref:hypothetical protein n=1 Tax=unclassified Streptomyces TaxID=2593676 RepID=UPI00093B6E20|nr:hypothetical protein [Streptomyces sp. CB01883]OKJ74391.1 hypothetical protein AMK32_35995 [Streptomyces sp. CB01883]